MVYKDRAFCGSDCTKSECYRFFGENEETGAERWWGGPNAPVAFINFAANCEDYTPPHQQRKDR